MGANTSSAAQRRTSWGEPEKYEEAEGAFFDFVRAHPPAAEPIEVRRGDGTSAQRLPVDPEKIRRVTAA